jgi:hypothetical protein
MLVELTKGQYARIDEEDYKQIIAFKWQAQPTRLKNGFYAIRNNGTDESGTRLKVKMHRQIMNCPDGMEVDHINGNTLDNRKSNLRVCTHAQNIQYQKSRGGESRYRGVTKHHDGNWRARISVAYKRISLGVYKTQEAAYQAVLNAQRKYYD